MRPFLIPGRPFCILTLVSPLATQLALFQAHSCGCLQCGSKGEIQIFDFRASVRQTSPPIFEWESIVVAPKEHLAPRYNSTKGLCRGCEVWTTFTFQKGALFWFTLFGANSAWCAWCPHSESKFEVNQQESYPQTTKIRKHKIRTHSASLGPYTTLCIIGFQCILVSNALYCILYSPGDWRTFSLTSKASMCSYDRSRSLAL